MAENLTSPSRIRRFFNFCLLLTGLGLLVVIGGKAVMSINDRKFVDGVRQKPPETAPTIFNGRLISTQPMIAPSAPIDLNTNEDATSTDESEQTSNSDKLKAKAVLEEVLSTKSKARALGPNAEEKPNED